MWNVTFIILSARFPCTAFFVQPLGLCFEGALQMSQEHNNALAPCALDSLCSGQLPKIMVDTRQKLACCNKSDSVHLPSKLVGPGHNRSNHDIKPVDHFIML